MSPRVTLRVTRRDGFPRVSGDEPNVTIDGHHVVGFSPRERG